MTKPLQSLLAMLLLLVIHQSYAQVTQISNNTNLSSGFVLPNGIPLLQNDDGSLWTTNGTTATQITAAVFYPSDSTGASLFNSQLYFGGRDAATGDVELWVTDGTAASTKLIKNIAAGGSSLPDDFFVFNNTLYFTADDGVHGRELWKSSGAVGNASLVADINPGADSAFDNGAAFFQNGNNIFFSPVTGGATGLWKLDLSGTPSSVKNITGEVDLSILACAALGAKTVFTVRTGDPITGSGQLWVTDGTAGNTSLLKDFGIGSSSMFPQLTAFNGVLFFDGFDILGKGIELWTTDGTAANTKLFKDIDPGNGSSAPALFGSAVLNGKMYFDATTAANGEELWVTDGTAGNTKILKDINPGADDAAPVFLPDIGVYADIISTENFNNFNFQQLFSSTFNGKLYFFADDGTHGIELWSTDGTNTALVKDINPGSDDGTDESGGAIYTTTGIYFTANDGTNGLEPWVTDGTSGNTKIVANINTAANEGSDPLYEFVYNHQIYLNADNADNSNGNTDLYKINQTVVILPVNLLSFNVALNGGNAALGWTTANEINTSRFVVERSTDGVHFDALGTVAAAGNSTNAHQYQYSDGNVLQTGASTLYYRLRIIDNDGRYTYSATLPVQLQGGKFTITLSPNPVHDRLTVVFSTNNAKNITLRVTDANGKPVYQQQFQTNGLSALQQNINVARFAGGTYFVQLITGKETKTAAFIKQ